MRRRTVSVCALAAVCLSAPALAAAAGTTAPRAARAASDLAPLTRLTMGQTARVTLPVDQGLETLELTRFTPMAPGAAVVAVQPDGTETPVDLSGLVLLKGTIAGDPDSLAFLSYMDGRVNGFVRSAEGVRIISSGPAGDSLSYELASNMVLGDADQSCSVIVGDPAFYPENRLPEVVRHETMPATRGTAPCRVARVAVDTDYEFTQLFGGNTALSAAYAVTLLSASSSIYERDVNVRFLLPYVRVFAANNDPYVGSSGTTDFLFEMQDHWNLAMSHIPREVTHGLSGRGLGGGVAYLNATCFLDYAYGVSANLGGFFPLPIQDNSHQNWDLMVVSHELGHNFGSGHTHDGYTPPIDGCGNGDCALALDSTIMSYCHLCPGGLSNVDMRFGPRVEARILEFLDSAGCNLTAGATPLPVNDSFTVLSNATMDLDVLSNDAAAACAPTPVSISSLPATSANGGTVAVSATNAFSVTYTPAPGYTGPDSFTYTTPFGPATVSVNVIAMRQAVAVPNTEPGVAVDYFALSNPQSMPNFDALTPYASDILPDINIPSTEGNFATSGRADGVGAVFTSLLEVPADGWYRLSIESDDGSRLWIDNDLIVDNDGLHGMVDAGSNIPLQAGKHRLTAEFFENGGGAGVIVRFAGPGLANQPVPATNWSREITPPCPADLAAPFGTLDFFDVAAFLTYFSNQNPLADLAAPAGVFNFFDISEFLARYNAGCP